MSGRPLYKGDALINGTGFYNDQKALVQLEAFNPSNRLVEDVNKSMNSTPPVPLLVTGDKYRRELVAQSVAYEFNEKEFQQLHCIWKLKKADKFKTGIYSYDHKSKKRDLEYFKIDPEGNPVQKPEYYYKSGQFLRSFEIMKSIGVRSANAPRWPILEIHDIHLVGKNFINKLMAFLSDEEDILIPELGITHKKSANKFPFVIMTAEEDYVLPRNHDGVIYSHQLEFPAKEDFILELIPRWKMSIVPGFPDLLGKAPFFPKVEALIEIMVDIFFLTKENGLLRPGDSQFPMTIPELYQSIKVEVLKLCADITQADHLIGQLKFAYNSQVEICQNADLGKSKEAIKTLIEQNKLSKALSSLKLIQKNLAKHQQIEISQLLSKYKSFSEKERMGTESELILYPMKNKLIYDILKFLDTIAENSEY